MEGGWIVGSKNDADYIDMSGTVQARRRQIWFNLPFCDAFSRPYYLGVHLDMSTPAISGGTSKFLKPIVPIRDRWQ